MPKKVYEVLLRNVNAKFWHKHAFYQSLDKVEKIIVHTEVSARILQNFYPNFKGKIEVVPIPIMPPITVTKTILEKRPGEIWLMMLGFVSQYKGHKLALDALKLLPSNYKLVVAGGPHPHDGNAHAYWRQLLQTVDFHQLIERVKFTGFIKDRHDYFSVMSQADVFLMPYDEVGQSASAVLADILSFEKPIVTSTAKSMWEYRYSPDSFGCCIAADVTDPEHFVAQILYALDESKKSEPIFVKHTRAVIRASNLEKVSRTYQRIYQEQRKAA